jgi:hypothetical protein
VLDPPVSVHDGLENGGEGSDSNPCPYEDGMLRSRRKCTKIITYF